MTGDIPIPDLSFTCEEVRKGKSWRVGTGAVLIEELNAGVNGVHRLVVSGVRERGPRGEAQLRLMAAAPELLCAAQDAEMAVSGTMRQDQGVRAILRAAIAKAQGGAKEEYWSKRSGTFEVRVYPAQDSGQEHHIVLFEGGKQVLMDSGITWRSAVGRAVHILDERSAK